MAKAKGLGRGLDALFGDEQASSAAPQGIRLSDIEPNPRQPRQDFDPAALEELAQSIRENGVLQPVTVRKNSQKDYELISGERRLRAAKEAGLQKIPAVVMDTTARRSEIVNVEKCYRKQVEILTAQISRQEGLYRKCFAVCFYTQRYLRQTDEE